MTTVAELLVNEELAHLREIAERWGWTMTDRGAGEVLLGLTAKEGEAFWLLIDTTGYPVRPAAFHWSDASGSRRDDRSDTPRGGGFFHSSGRICAPWNRLAYKQVTSNGPHSDWDLAGWKTNPKTGATTTLSAMVLRVHHELRASFQGRLG